MRTLRAFQTLMAIASAILILCAVPEAVHAYCVPIVRAIPSPIITNDTQVSGSAVYVYPDAFNINTYGANCSDGGTVDIVWSFTSLNGRYLINGAPPLVAGDNRTTPPANKIINSPNTISNSGEIDLDSNVLTITFRDRFLSPLGGPATSSNQAPGSLIGSDIITLF